MKSDLLKVAQAALEYIDALPKDIQLPAMPGFDRDWANGVLAQAASDDAKRPPSISRAIVFYYRNYRGEEGYRCAIPISFRFGTSEYHDRPQMLMLAFDTEKNAEREFAVCDIKSVVGECQIPARNDFDEAKGARISELLGVNNKFEERARVAGRRAKRLADALANARGAIASLEADALGGHEPSTPDEESYSFRDALLGEIDAALSAEGLTLPGKRADNHRDPMSQERIESMEAHVDEGGRLSHQNGAELLSEVVRLRILNADRAAIWRSKSKGELDWIYTDERLSPADGARNDEGFVEQPLFEGWAPTDARL